MDPMAEARRVRVTGVVQGVGFRPFVWRLAQAHGLAGWVRNDGAGVDIHIQGASSGLDAFLVALKSEAPPLARLEGIAVDPAVLEDRAGFRILESAGGRVSTAIGHDSAVCADCLAEMFNPADRRWRHAFITCTHCGPRYTVARGLPYDRGRTSLAPFPLCPDCGREYREPADRRFHAETTCCPACGPQLSLLDAGGTAVGGDPLAGALALLRAGRIVAVKGLGGFHLVCDARNPVAVAALRQRKAREEKPFAVMGANGASFAGLATVGEKEGAWLAAAERPIVLLPKTENADEMLPGVAPGLAWLGALLPYTPLQYLLFHEAAGRPAGCDWLAKPQPLFLVMTSANPGGEPLVIGNDEALRRLAGIADAYLLHDREIVVRCDDSVLRDAGGTPQFVRRARGYTPRAIGLPRPGPSVLALGAWFKNTVCVTRGDEAFVSQHVGDLDNAAGCAFLEEIVGHLLSILQVEPDRIACDCHPDFHSSRFAAAFAAERGLPLIRVQHHQAHGAAVLAEHGHEAPALVLALDGIGLGTDGEAWGGELLRLDGAFCERLGRLRPLPLPGGDRAAREPWRMGAAALQLIGAGDEISRRFAGQPGAKTVAEMLARNLNCPPTSSAGRLFDAAAGLLNLRPVMGFEGQAAMLLEGRAAAHGPAAPWSDGWSVEADGQLDLRPLLRHLAAATDADLAAARFHATLASALADWVAAAADGSGIRTVVGAGGCFLNALLSSALRAELPRRGLRFLEAGLLPPNDGGISLGQAWVALHTKEI